MISKKLQILIALTAHLESTITGLASPATLLGKVFRGRVVFGEEVKPPFLAILEDPRQIAPEEAGSANLVRNENWRLLIQGFVPEEDDHPSDAAYDLMARVEQRMSRLVEEPPNGMRGGRYPTEFRLGGLVSSLQFQIPVVRPGKDDVSDTAYFYMPVAVGLKTDITNPFEQEI